MLHLAHVQPSLQGTEFKSPCTVHARLCRIIRSAWGLPPNLPGLEVPGALEWRTICVAVWGPALGPHDAGAVREGPNGGHLPSDVQVQLHCRTLCSVVFLPLRQHAGRPC